MSTEYSSLDLFLKDRPKSNKSWLFSLVRSVCKLWRHGSSKWRHISKCPPFWIWLCHVHGKFRSCHLFWSNLLWKARKVDYFGLNAVSVGKDWICAGSWWYGIVGAQQVDPSLQQCRLRRRQIFKPLDLLFFCYLCRYGCVQCVYCLCDRSSYGNLQWKARVWHLLLRHNRLHCVLYHCDAMPRLCTKGLFVLLSWKSKCLRIW